MDLFDYEKHKGKWVDEQGRSYDSAPRSAFVIIAGAWGRPGLVGAMQSKCKLCSSLVALAPDSQKLLRENPELPILCTGCFELLSVMRQVLESEEQ